MMSPQELGWLVVMTSMVLGASVCVGVCLTLWCKKNSGGKNKMNPATILDPVALKNGKQPSHASYLLPSVTRSEFGSEPRTPSSSVTPLSAQSRSYWSLSKSSSQAHIFSQRYSSPASYGTSPGFRDVYVPYSTVMQHHLPHKYATTYYSRSSAPIYRDDRIGNRSSHWSTLSSPSEELPLVPSTHHTYMPQPRIDSFISSVDSESSGSIRHKIYQESDDSTHNRNWKTHNERKNVSKSRHSSHSNEDRNIHSGIGGRRRLVSGLGYSDAEVMNPCFEGSSPNIKVTAEDSSDCKSESSIRGRRKSRRSRTSTTSGEVSSFEKEALEAVSRRLQELSLSPRDSSPGSGMIHSKATPIPISTGIKLEQIPHISSSIGSSPSRDSSRTRNTRRGRITPMKDDVINHLGIESRLSPMTSPTSDDSSNIDFIRSQQRRRESISLRDDNIPSTHDLDDFQSAGSLSGNKTMAGALGYLEIQLKYQSAQEQLILRIISARNIPSRYLLPGAKLYVKVVIDGVNKYTTPMITAREPATFQITLAHPISSCDLGSVSIRFSMCQLDTRNRRVVVGYATLHPLGLWPILYLNTTLSHNLTTHNLLLNLTDTTPDHQIDCGGSVTFGLLVSEDMSDITVTSVTLQQLGGKDMSENCLAYVKVSLYRGNELITWKRSKPTLLNRQRTHLVHQLELHLKEVHLSVSNFGDFGNESDILIGKDEDKEEDKPKAKKSNKRAKNENNEKSSPADEDTEKEDGEDFASASSVHNLLLVLSVRMKTLKRGGRCVLGSVHLGEESPSEEGRHHWRRAVSQAAVGVPAAGSHKLTHD